MSIESIRIIVDVSAMLISVLAIIVSAYKVNQQLELSLFEKYTARYSQIMQSMPEEFFHENIANIADDKKKEINHYIRSYLDLCSEEFYLHEQKRIDDTVWREWEGGILAAFKNPLVLAFWETNDAYRKSYQNFSNFINEKLKAKNYTKS